MESLIGLLYDAALGESAWSELAGAVAACFSSHSAVVKTFGGAAGTELVAVTDNLNVSPRESEWAAHWHRNDLWVERSALLPTGKVFTSQELMGEAAFEKTAFYQDWTRHLDIYHMVGVLFPINELETGVLGVHRVQGAGAYGMADEQRLAALFPHVRRAVGLRHRLRHTELAQRASLDALDRLDTAVLAVNARCELLYANATAENLLRNSAELNVRARRLRVTDPELDDLLHRQVREAVNIAAGRPAAVSAVLAITRVGRLPVTVLVTPLRATWASADVAEPAALVFLRDPEGERQDRLENLRDLFGLTRAEAVVAMAVGEGRSSEQLAATLGVGIGTVRTHLKKVLAKTGTCRQSALAALVAGSVAGAAR